MLVEEKDVLEERLRVMQNMDWVSKQTRAVIVEFSVYVARLGARSPAAEATRFFACTVAAQHV